MHSENYKWITGKEYRKRILLSFSQPLTAAQIVRKTRFDLDTCSSALVKFTQKGMAYCLNSQARSGRVYWLTDAGLQTQLMLKWDNGNTEATIPAIPAGVDWELYGLVCYRQRSAVIQAITQPMQPCQIKRYLKIHKPHITISQNNIRDIKNEFLKYGIIQKIFFRKKAYPAYELTGQGLIFQKLLNQAEMPI